MIPFDSSGAFHPVAEGGELRRLAVRGAAATLSAAALSLGLRVIGTVLLARLLTPTDFGVVAMVTTFSLLLMSFGTSGLSEAVIQREEINESQASNLFWITCVIGLILTLGFAASGPLLARFFRNALVVPVTAGTAIAIFVNAAGTVHSALLKRAMRFTAVSANDLVALVTYTGVTIVLSLRGWGYWALVGGNVAQVLSGPYRIPHIRIDVSLMMTNKTPAGTYRGPGRYEADFFRERLFDIAAAELGIDPVEFRRRNLIAEAEMPYRLATVEPLAIQTETDSGDYEMTLARCLEEMDWTAKAAMQGKLIDGRYRGTAIGCYLEGGASGPSENARLVLESDGKVSVYVGSSSIGQGLETVCAQIAADALELPMDDINGVFHGSTDHVTDGCGSYSSRAVVMGGNAIVAAAAKLRDAIAADAAERWGCGGKDVKIDAGAVRGPDRQSLPLAAFAGTAAEATYASNKRTYSYGAHAAHVAVDPKTGHVELLDYVAVEDAGRIINPLTLHGQVVGAIVQGLGGAFLEHFVYDHEGQLLTGSFADYLMPTASDFPHIRAIALEERPSPNNPLGAKGAGEGGIIPVGGVIANAVAAALGSLGVEPRELPLSPPRVWELIQGRIAAG